MRMLLESLLEESFATVEKARQSVRRQFHFPKTDQMIKVAIGMRRSGKTYFLYQTINQLLDEGVLKEQILLINFEDDRLLPMNAKEMGQLIDAFYSMYPANHDRCCYLFFDEVQNVLDWHLVVRRYFDTKHTQLYLTGSSAKLLSKEINTSLRGRSLALTIFPYSFKEYLAAHAIEYKTAVFGQKAFDVMQQHLHNYFSLGGFPAVQSMEVSEWRETLQGYVDTVILRDIIERYNVTNIALLKYLVTTLLKNSATQFSINKFYNEIKGQGFKVSKDTIYSYLDYIQDSFLIFSVPFYSESEREKRNRPKKIYAIDTGLVRAFSLGVNSAFGQFLETLVYLDLKRDGKKVYFYTTEDGFEIDFVAVDALGKRELIQVSWDTSDPKVMEREQRALDQAKEELGLDGRIITARDYLRAIISHQG